MYEIKFNPNLGFCGGDEVNEKLDMFNYRNMELLNKEIKPNYDDKEYEDWFICTTKEESLTEVLAKICISFEINDIIVKNLNPIEYKL